MGETEAALPVPFSANAVMVLGEALLQPVAAGGSSSESAAAGRLRVIQSGSVVAGGIVAVLA